MPVDQVFCLRHGEWQAIYQGKVLPATWSSRGAALAGLAVAQRTGRTS